MKTKNIIWLSLILVLSGLFSCKEIDTYSPIPEIKYKDFILSNEVLYDTSDLGFPYIGGTLIFEFRDGNGDFGYIRSAYSNIVDTNNVFITQLEKRDGVYYEYDVADSSRQKRKQCILYEDVMERSGQNKLIQGTIEIFYWFIFSSKDLFDTIKYSFYITDQEKNKSNVELSDEIVIDWDSYEQ